MMLEVYDRKLMNARDTKKYRHKVLRGTSVNTVMGEIHYRRVTYEVKINILETKKYQKLNANSLSFTPQQIMTDRDIEREKLIKDNKLNKTLKQEWNKKSKEESKNLFQKM